MQKVSGDDSATKLSSNAGAVIKGGGDTSDDRSVFVKNVHFKAT
jgi:hypothetical protein